LLPKGHHDFHRFIAPDDLVDRLAARELTTTHLQGMRITDEPRAVLTDDTTLSYLGCAIKRAHPQEDA
jgi:hypothetical protein